LYELIDHLLIAEDEGYISKEELTGLKKDIMSCLGLLNGYINYVQKAKAMKSM